MRYATHDEAQTTALPEARKTSIVVIETTYIENKVYLSTIHKDYGQKGDSQT